jgi:hypothetical protein
MLPAQRAIQLLFKTKGHLLVVPICHVATNGWRTTFAKSNVTKTFVSCSLEIRLL